MTNHMKCIAAAFAMAIGSVSGGALAEDYPDKPVRLVVPFPAGGATDVIGRVVAAKLASELGGNVIVENKGGAGTVIGANFVANAPADGYTLLISSGSTFTVNPAVRPNLSYDAQKSFTPLALLARGPMLLVVNDASPIKTVQDIVAAAKRDGLMYGSFGAATTGHLAVEMLRHQAGIPLTHVPYKGSAPLATDLVGNQIPLAIDTFTSASPHLKSGRVRAIAVTSATRSKLVPDVPTIAESGFPGFNADVWLAVVGPHGLPADISQKITLALQATMQDAEVRAKIEAAGMEVTFADGGKVAALISEELPVMRKVAEESNIRPE